MASCGLFGWTPRWSRSWLYLKETIMQNCRSITQNMRIAVRIIMKTIGDEAVDNSNCWRRTWRSWTIKLNILSQTTQSFVLVQRRSQQRMCLLSHRFLRTHKQLLRCHRTASCNSPDDSAPWPHSYLKRLSMHVVDPELSNLCELATVRGHEQ